MFDENLRGTSCRKGWEPLYCTRGERLSGLFKERMPSLSLSLCRYLLSYNRLNSNGTLLNRILVLLRIKLKIRFELNMRNGGPPLRSSG